MRKSPDWTANKLDWIDFRLDNHEKNINELLDAENKKKSIALKTCTTLKHHHAKIEATNQYLTRVKNTIDALYIEIRNLKTINQELEKRILSLEMEIELNKSEKNTPTVFDHMMEEDKYNRAWLREEIIDLTDDDSLTCYE